MFKQLLWIVFSKNKTQKFLLDKKIKKIILTGPESSGKSTLTQQLAQYFNTAWVPEFARTYLMDLNRPYREDDLPRMAKMQNELEAFLSKKANRFLFCDTGFLVFKIWSEVRFGKCDPWILEQLKKEENVLYILCMPDFTWQPDPLRENPNDRDQLLKKYQAELKNYNKTYIQVSGNQKNRLNYSIQSILHFFQ